MMASAPAMANQPAMGAMGAMGVPYPPVVAASLPGGAPFIAGAPSLDPLPYHNGHISTAALSDMLHQAHDHHRQHYLPSNGGVVGQPSARHASKWTPDEDDRLR